MYSSSMPDVVTYISPLCIVFLCLLCFCRFALKSCLAANERERRRTRDVESPHRCYRSRRSAHRRVETRRAHSSRHHHTSTGVARIQPVLLHGAYYCGGIFPADYPELFYIEPPPEDSAQLPKYEDAIKLQPPPAYSPFFESIEQSCEAQSPPAYAVTTVSEVVEPPRPSSSGCLRTQPDRPCSSGRSMSQSQVEAMDSAFYASLHVPK